MSGALGCAPTWVWPAGFSRRCLENWASEIKISQLPEVTLREVSAELPREVPNNGLPSISGFLVDFRQGWHFQVARDPRQENSLENDRVWPHFHLAAEVSAGRIN